MHFEANVLEGQAALLPMTSAAAVTGRTAENFVGERVYKITASHLQSDDQKLFTACLLQVSAYLETKRYSNKSVWNNGSVICKSGCPSNETPLWNCMCFPTG